MSTESRRSNIEDYAIEARVEAGVIKALLISPDGYPIAYYHARDTAYMPGMGAIQWAAKLIYDIKHGVATAPKGD